MIKHCKNVGQFLHNIYLNYATISVCYMTNVFKRQYINEKSRNNIYLAIIVVICNMLLKTVKNHENVLY